MQMLDLNDNYNLVAKTNHRPINKVLKSSCTVDKHLGKQYSVTNKSSG